MALARAAKPFWADIGPCQASALKNAPAGRNLNLLRIETALAFRLHPSQSAIGGVSMFWKRKPEAPIALEPQVDTQQPTPEIDIAQAILEYQRSFSDSLKQAENAEAEAARRLIAEANKIVGESRIGPAFVPTLLEHIKYWPSWSTQKGFDEHVHFPARDITAENDPREANGPAVTRIHFIYNDHDYGVIFTDEGISSWGRDAMAYGKVELHYQGHCVLGLDIGQDCSKEFPDWRWQNVFAFIPGTWMKELIEIAAHIEAGRRRQMQGYSDKAALDRASRIKL